MPQPNGRRVDAASQERPDQSVLCGVEPHGIDPKAVKVMAEVGIDISGQASKHLDTLQGIEFDYVITLCDQANESCPCFSEKPATPHGF